MGFWIFMFVSVLLVPAIMLIVGRLFIKRPPREINGLYGYRTTMSMKNKDTWDFAHRYCGRMWLRWGAVLLVVTVIPMLCVIRAGIERVSVTALIIMGVQIAVLIASIFPTERALKRTFDKDGNRR